MAEYLNNLLYHKNRGKIRTEGSLTERQIVGTETVVAGISCYLDMSFVTRDAIKMTIQELVPYAENLFYIITVLSYVWSFVIVFVS